MAQHTLIRKLEQVFTLQRPLQVSNSTLRDCFAVFTGARGSSGPGGAVYPGCPL